MTDHNQDLKKGGKKGEKWRNSQKGQAAITDLFIAISVFIILITIITLTWNLYNIRLVNRFEYDDMIIKTFQVSDALSKSKGVPDNWEFLKDKTQILVVGLAENERKISTQKLTQFIDLNETEIKEKMNINLYNFYFTIRNQTQVLVSHGRIPTGKKSVNIARLVIYNGKPSIMEFALWL